MTRMKLLYITTTALCFGFTAQAQIFINTGNPHMNKYTNNDPNAVIWNEGTTVPSGNGTTAPATTTTTGTNSGKVSNGAYIPAEPSPNDIRGDYPPNAIAGKCYARCFTPDEYEMKEQEIVDKPASFRFERVAAVYTTVYDTQVIKAAYKKTILIPAEYDLITEDQLVTAASQKWVKGKADKNCLSADPKDCEVWCLVEEPAVYRKVTRKVEKTPAYTQEVDVPAITKVSPRQQLVQEAYDRRVEIPATYKTIMARILVKKGGFQGWKEVLCEQDVTTNRITQIQNALKREGYDPGPVDNTLGPKTKEALIKFQQDKGLPVGNLNMETMNALGVY